MKTSISWFLYLQKSSKSLIQIICTLSYAYPQKILFHDLSNAQDSNQNLVASLIWPQGLQLLLRFIGFCHAHLQNSINSTETIRLCTYTGVWSSETSAFTKTCRQCTIKSRAEARVILTPGSSTSPPIIEFCHAHLQNSINSTETMNSGY